MYIFICLICIFIRHKKKKYYHLPQGETWKCRAKSNKPDRERQIRSHLGVDTKNTHTQADGYTEQIAGF